MLIFGDFNYDLLKPNTAARHYQLTLKENAIQILNKIDPDYCTRETNTTRTILDHVCSSLQQNEFHLVLIESAMADHKQIFLEVKKCQQFSVRQIQYNAIDYTKLYTSFQLISEDNDDHTYASLERKILTCLSNSKIKKIKFLNPPKQDWINRDVIDAINKRNKLWQLKNRPDLTNINIDEDLDKQKKLVTEIIQNSKTNYYLKTFNTCINKPAKMWNLINSLSINKIKNVLPPIRLQIDSKVIVDETEVCEQFNLYFSTIGLNLANEILSLYPIDNMPPLVTNKDEITTFEPVSIDEVDKII
ncbi:unnamed protein product [Euphydryas editha]|uniref:Endonuclease/exonuclease/phosphatase domain-containing protein n=1 Tax=Euphydryas editha TaxID=104508 RepID=A0AAU9VF25_EUPED|nr:unnamed protein product [Euphydryas editha]